MSLPWSYEYKITIKANSEQAEMLKNQFKNTLLSQLKNRNNQEIESHKKQLNFSSKNTLFGITSKIQIEWKFKPKFTLNLRFDMVNFIRLLSIFALTIGFLGKLSFRHYLLITFISLLILYGLYFFILYVWSQKLLRNTLNKIIPDYFEAIEIAQREEKYQENRKPYDKSDTSRKGNYIIKYDYKTKNDETTN